MRELLTNWRSSVLNGRLSLFLLLILLMIFSMALGYLPSRCNRSSSGVNRVVESTRRPSSSDGSVM